MKRLFTQAREVSPQHRLVGTGALLAFAGVALIYIAFHSGWLMLIGIPAGAGLLYWGLSVANRGHDEIAAERRYRLANPLPAPSDPAITETLVHQAEAAGEGATRREEAQS
ncbi:hypothetical protein [Kineosporia succinea]|uniref:DUF3099 family protein n=1 Tax=Kineosporia succinea TaxID=84632 RepID=A0ABT9NXW5_9ACTN|nr:hypothetical protein [Kineosporia succinea]MDP9825264.1 hypothetical protein [Kineosporia succinea]